MRSYRLLPSLLLLIPAIAACSSSSKDKPDAFVVVADAPIDNPPPPPGCAYGELRDDTNDDALSTGSAEDTMVTFGGSTVVCGKFNSARYDAAKKKVDADAYSFTVAADAQVYVSIYGAGLEALGEVDIQVYGGQGFANLVASGTFYANHGAVTVPLGAGTYELYARAYNPAAPASDVAYKIKLTTDDLNAHCPLQTTGGYAEAHDNANNLGNDMIGFNDDPNITDPAMALFFTASTADVPEPSALTIADGMKYRFTGSANIANPVAGSYHDRDTFEITTGANTNELTIRLNWGGADADLDLAVFEKPAAGATTPNEIQESRYGSTMGAEGEWVTTAVKPNTAYWVWLGTYNDPTSTATEAYSTSICGVNYTPPN